MKFLKQWYAVTITLGMVLVLAIAYGLLMEYGDPWLKIIISVGAFLVITAVIAKSTL